MRLIDADALGIGTANPGVFQDRAYADGWNSAVSILENAPTVDAVPVVRCKDCVHYRETCDWDGCAYKACHHRADVIITKRASDDYCSYGERRD